MAFLDLVVASRAGFLACYAATHATSPVELAIVATFDDVGHLGTLTLTPSLGSAFEGCAQQLAVPWTLTPSEVTTFKASIRLVPGP